jgi:CheY-like chemotaxis protein
VALRILIVEDDPHTRRILEAFFPRDPLLAAAGVEVTALDDGEQALRALDRHPYDLIISDLVMPRMDFRAHAPRASSRKWRQSAARRH